ncbi:MAG: ATPase domain-containing protein [Halobacteria archaeon]
MKILKTYVEGLDEKLGGGIPEKHIVVVTGNPGTLKSTITYNILYHNAKNEGVKGAYVSLEQRAEDLTAQMDRLGMKHADVKKDLVMVDVGKVRFVTEDYGLKKGWIFIVQDLIKEAKEQVDFSTIVIDSLDVFETMFGGEDPRINLFKFLEFLKGMNLTCFLIAEMSMDSKEYAKHGIDFLADGIIALSLAPVKVQTQMGFFDDPKERVRSIACVKLRGMNNSTQTYQLVLENNKLKVTDLPVKK